VIVTASAPVMLVLVAVAVPKPMISHLEKP
jgi:hypothetical protein